MYNLYITMVFIRKIKKKSGIYLCRIPAYANLCSIDLDKDGKAVISKFKKWILTPRREK